MRAGWWLSNPCVRCGGTGRIAIFRGNALLLGIHMTQIYDYERCPCTLPPAVFVTKEKQQ